MKRKIKKIIAGILFASMLTGNVSMNVVYGTENYGDRIEENQSANIEDGVNNLLKRIIHRIKIRINRRWTK